MAHGWVKSLQCKSRAFEDVYNPNANPKKPLPVSSSCRSGARTLKDVVETTKQKHRKLTPSREEPPGSKPRRSGKLEPRPDSHSRRHSHRVDGFTATLSGPLFPALTELPEGHPSRNVVEIIFHTSWGPKAFSGFIDMIFKVQNGSRTVARFEEYRDEVRSRSRRDVKEPRDYATVCEENARCAADGNEVMRFQCVGPTSAALGPHEAAGGTWATTPRGKGAMICTFSGSGCAHESAGKGRGRRAMLVCRVIAGRVKATKQFGLDPSVEARLGFDSVSGDNGELLVFDSRAVLPCFLIIYRL